MIFGMTEAPTIGLEASSAPERVLSNGRVGIADYHYITCCRFLL